MGYPSIICGSGVVCEAIETDKNIFTVSLTPLFKEMVNSKGEGPDEYIYRCTLVMQEAVAKFIKKHADLC